MDFVIQSSVVIVPALIGWIVVSSYLLFTGRVRWSFHRHIVLTSFVVYVLLLVHVTVFPIHVHTGTAREHVHFRESINFIPLVELRDVDFVLNIFMTIPLGLFLPIVFRRRYGYESIALFGITLGAAFELNQYILRITIANDRFVDVNDVIANASGVILGYGFYRLAVRRRPLLRAALALLLR